MAQNNKIVVMIATLLFAAIGLIISLFLKEVLNEQALSQSGVIKDILDVITSPEILTGIIWLLICIFVFYGVRMVIDEGENVGPISIYFLIIWLGAVVGLVLGNIAWLLIKGNALTIDLDTLVNSLSLFTALGPTFAAALGISTK